MNQFLGALGRKSSVVNLDAANNNLSYPCAINIFSLISLEEIMQHEQLGPNGAIMYALETLEANFEWLEDELAKLGGARLKKRDSDGQMIMFYSIAQDKSSYSHIMTR